MRAPCVLVGRAQHRGMMRVLALRLAVLTALVPAPALAWGAAGHRMIGWTAVRALPAELPAFLRTPQAAADVAELSREPDRSRGAGKTHDADRDPAHHVDLDGGEGGLSLTALPPTREDYDTALRAQGTTSWKVGYLPYAIVDRWQQLRLDFAYWRALDAAERNPAWAGRRAWFVADRKRREGLILHTLGELSHFVGDGGQPLHVTVHYNGWGNYPNPAGYTQARIHGPFEGALVYTFVQPKNVAARMTPPAPCDCAVEVRVGAYLAESNRRVVPLYELEKAGGLEGEDLRGARFAAVQLARSASELRDLILMAWRDSPREMIGWKPVLTADILSGRVDPYDALYTVD